MDKKLQTQMNKAKRQLVGVRQEVETRKEMIAALEGQLEDNETYQALLSIQEGMPALNKQEAAAKVVVGELLVQAAEATGERTFDAGKVVSSVVVDWSVEKAVDWCLTSGMKHLLTTTKDFKDQAKLLAPTVDWATATTVLKPRVSSKIE